MLNFELYLRLRHVTNQFNIIKMIIKRLLNIVLFNKKTLLIVSIVKNTISKLNSCGKATGLGLGTYGNKNMQI